MAVDCRLEADPFDPAVELAAFLRGRAHEGAVVSFTGLVRGDPGDSLTVQAYPGLTERTLRQIAEDACARFSVPDVLIVHRHGRMNPGEPIVFVAAASAHRRDAFEAADYLMDRLKTDAAFWKHQDGPQGARWIEPTHADRDARSRWRTP